MGYVMLPAMPHITKCEHITFYLFVKCLSLYISRFIKAAGQETVNGISVLVNIQQFEKPWFIFRLFTITFYSLPVT